MILHVLVAYAPFWYLGAVLLVGGIAFAREIARPVNDVDRYCDLVDQELDEIAARRAVRPWPAPIDVELLRRPTDSTRQGTGR